MSLANGRLTEYADNMPVSAGDLNELQDSITRGTHGVLREYRVVENDYKRLSGGWQELLNGAIQTSYSNVAVVIPIRGIKQGDLVHAIGVRVWVDTGLCSVEIFRVSDGGRYQLAQLGPNQTGVSDLRWELNEVAMPNAGYQIVAINGSSRPFFVFGSFVESKRL